MPPKVKTNVNAGSAEEINKMLSSRVDKLEEFLQTGLKELKNQISSSDNHDVNDGASTFLTNLNDFESKVQESISAIKLEINMVQKQLECNKNETENLQRERMMNVLVLYGMPEKEREDLCGDVCKIIKNKLKMDISVNDLNYCYRLGKKRGNEKTPRPTAIVFTNRWKLDNVYRAKRNLKGCGYVIGEMLLVKTRELFLKVRAVVGAKNCWTVRGKIFAIINNAKKLITSESDLADP